MILMNIMFLNIFAFTIVIIISYRHVTCLLEMLHSEEVESQQIVLVMSQDGTRFFLLVNLIYKPRHMYDVRIGLKVSSRPSENVGVT